MTAAGPSVGPRSVTARALQVLAAFSRDKPVLSLSELARRAGLPLTTAHRLAGDLLEWGALERDDEGRFHIGLRLWELGSLAPRGQALRDVALPFLEDLYEVTHENVQLAVREGTELVWVERIAGRRALPVLTRVGGRFALHATGAGLVLLAYAPVEVQEEVLARPLERFTAHTIVDPAEVRRVLAVVRRTGVAVSDRQVQPDAWSVAAPVHGAASEVVAALSVVVPAPDCSPAALVAAVQTAARGISRSLQAQGGLPGRSATA